jgi:hypothetical protein
LGAVDPVVHGPQETVVVDLGVAAVAVVPRHDRLLVARGILIGVPAEDEVGWSPDEDPVRENLDGAREHQLVGEHRPSIRASVVIHVVEHDDAPSRRIFGSGPMSCR